MLSTKYLNIIVVGILALLLAACEEESVPEKEQPKPEFFSEPDREIGAPVQPKKSGEGDCANFDLSPYIDENGKLDLSIQLRILRDQANVYPSPEAQQPKSQVAFSTPLKPDEIKQGLIKVIKLGEDEPLGWISQEDLLCSNRPLIDPNKGLEKKFFIKTEIQQRKAGEPLAFVNAYPMPDKQCHNKCRELSRFAMYFIVDQQDDWYLLADDYHITRPLVGWVRKSDGYLWDTAYGLRPRDNLKYVDKTGEAEGTICVYRSLENAINNHHCMPVLGGKSWYQISQRIPLLDIVDHNGAHIPPVKLADSGNRPDAFYKVALAMPGVGTNPDAKGQLTITPEQLREPSIEEALASMKFIDVLFLIDGTASMQPVIDMIRGTYGVPGLVQTIANRLRNDPDFKASKLRFGFRIYRDNYGRWSELGEAMSLPAKHCQELPANYLEQNLSKFQQHIAKVQVSKDDKGQDDYPENLFGGLNQVLKKDLRACAAHTKLLFVIGDHGYDENARRAKARSVFSINQLESLISKRKGENNGRWVTFFIQTPNKAHAAKTPKAYNRAYELYCTQAYAFVQQMLKGTKSRPEDYIIRLQEPLRSTESLCGDWNPTPMNADKLGEHILGAVKGFSKYSIMEELTVDLRGGAGLKKAIERLRQKHTDIPGLFWEFIEHESCETLGEQCTQRVYETNFEGYIPVTDDITLDVWMTGRQILDWKQGILSVFEGIYTQRSSVRRAEIEKTIAENLKLRLRKPEISASETYAEYLQRKKGLPVRTQSPLLSYTPTQLRDKGKVPDCEIDRLAVWATNVGDMLGIIHGGRFRPDFRAERFPKSACPKASDNGKQIPFIDGSIGKKPLGKDDSYRYDHKFRKTIIYWVPQEYLP
jgi:hypothetical protein